MKISELCPPEGEYTLLTKTKNSGIYIHTTSAVFKTSLLKGLPKSGSRPKLNLQATAKDVGDDDLDFYAVQDILKLITAGTLGLLSKKTLQILTSGGSSNRISKRNGGHW